jgi:hypothetical protein
LRGDGELADVGGVGEVWSWEVEAGHEGFEGGRGLEGWGGVDEGEEVVSP